MDRMLATANAAFERNQVAQSLVHKVRWLAGLFSCWRDRARERRLLAGLDARALADIGITRLDVARECAKPFWRA